MAIQSELAAAGTARYSSAAAENSHVVVAHQAVFYGFDGRNTDTGNACFIMVFDAKALPVQGTIPVICIGVGPAGTGVTADLGNFGWTSACSWGESFKNGIVIAASSTDFASGLTVLPSSLVCFHVQFASEDGLSSY
jgi:hypothetical protein